MKGNRCRQEYTSTVYNDIDHPGVFVDSSPSKVTVM